MERNVVGALAVIVGVIVVVSRRRFAKRAHAWNRFLCVRMGPEAEAASRAVVLIVGAGFILAGLLMLARIGRMGS